MARTGATPELGVDPRRVLITLLLQGICIGIACNYLYQQGTWGLVFNSAAVWNPWGLNPWASRGGCGLDANRDVILLSDRVVRPYTTGPGFVHFTNARIVTARTGGPGADRHAMAASYIRRHPDTTVIDFESAVISPGLIDLHAHLNEPGRTEWEGFWSGTRAAAAGGITTLFDMPINSRPATTNAGALAEKLRAARNQTAVDVGFWAGITPANARHPGELRRLVKAGALGFKSFLSPSGVDDFEAVTLEDVAAALPAVKALGVPYLLHAELVDDDIPDWGSHGEAPTREAPTGAIRSYAAFLARRPKRFEAAAVAGLLAALRADPGDDRPGFGLHIVHLSDAELLPELAAAKAEGLPLTVETCPHYLHFSAEEIADGETRFACTPPIRDAANRAALWAGIADGTIDAIASDHSPAPPEMKQVESGDFSRAWGGIAGIQYALPATFSGLLKHGDSMPSPLPGPQDPINAAAARLARLFASTPAQIAGIAGLKGSLRQSLDADIVVYDPVAMADTSPEARLHRHADTPWDEAELRGRVLSTYVRGRLVFAQGQGASQQSCGRPVTAAVHSIA